MLTAFLAVGLLHVLLVLAVVGLVVYLIVTYIPMPAVFKQVIIVVAVIVLILWLIRALGFVDIQL